MLRNIAIILAVLWAFGMVTSFTFGGFINVLIVIAVALIVVRIVKGTGEKPKGRTSG
jgi:hypothetical protein